MAQFDSADCETDKSGQKTFLYGPNDKVPAGKSAVYGIQFLVFYIASGAIIPVIIGASLGLDQAQIATMLQRTFLLVGAISILQFFFGHRLPIVEGPAGLWMGILVLLASTTSAMGLNLSTLRTDIEFGMICAGVMACVVAVSGLIVKILKLFTPLINGTFLILMAIQMSGSVIQGATGLSSGYTTVQGRFLIVFVVTVAVIIVVNLRASGFLQSIALLVGVACGWVLAYVLQIAPALTASGQGLFAVPQIFAWGMPTVNWGVILTCLIGEFVLFSNFATSLNGMSDLLQRPLEKREIKRGTFFLGIMAALCGLFSVAGTVPLASTPSMLRITRVAARVPFLLGGIFAMIMGLVAPICMFLSSIPPAVGYAALLVTIAMMVEQGLREYKKVDFTMREGMIVGVSIMIGAGILFLDTSAFQTLPQVLQYVVSNGLVMGLIVAILMEHVLLRKKPESKL